MVWTGALDEAAYLAAPMAAEYAEQLVDIQVAASPQSLQETRDCLLKLAESLTEALESCYKGEHREKDKRRLQGQQIGLESALMAIADEVELYETRIEANK